MITGISLAIPSSLIVRLHELAPKTHIGIILHTIADALLSNKIKKRMRFLVIIKNGIFSPQDRVTFDTKVSKLRHGCAPVTEYSTYLAFGHVTREGNSQFFRSQSEIIMVSLVNAVI